MPKNKIWVLHHNPGCEWWDKLHGAVVVAPTEEAARRMAADNAGEEGETVWLQPTESTCNVVRVDTTGLVLKDFKNA